MKITPTKKQKVLQKIEEGLTIESVSTSNNIPINTIKKWIIEYTNSGKDLKLFQTEQATTRYQPLTVKQIEWIYFIILNKQPKNFSLDGFLWNRNTFQNLIRHWCKKTYPTDSCYRLMSDLGFEFPTTNIKAITNTRNGVVGTLKDEKYHLFYFDTYKLKKGFSLLSPTRKKQTGCSIQRIKEVDTDYVVIYGQSLQKKGVKFLVKPYPLEESAIDDFIEKFSKDVLGRICLIIKKDNDDIFSAAYHKKIEMNYENIKVVVID
ncbi:MAG: hypothetical protein WA160_08510 [Pseudobdellovibrio sp.]